MTPFLLFFTAFVGCRPPRELTLLVGDCEAPASRFDARVPDLHAADSVSHRSAPESLLVLLCEGASTPGTAESSSRPSLYASRSVHVRGVYADIEVGPLVLGFTSLSWSIEGLSVVGDLSMEAGTEYGSESFTEHTARLASVDVSGDLWVDADLENTGELNTLDTTYGSSLTMDDVSVAGTAILGSRTVALYGVDVDGGTWTSARFFEAWLCDLHGVDAPSLTVVVNDVPGLVSFHAFEGIGGDVAFVESSYEAPVTFASDDLGEEWSCAFDDLGVDCTSRD